MNKQETGFDQICFGLNRELDKKSLALFLRLFSREELLRALIPRLADEEISSLVDYLTGFLHRHLEEKEYHELFLGDYGHHH
jgi:replication fork clamp-binding protein CrfC